MGAEIIIGLAVLGVGAAIAAFIRTPPELRLRLPQPVRVAGVEYAEQYSFRERVRLVAVGLAIAAPVVLGWQFWARPKWIELVEHLPCHDLWGVSGVTLFWYMLYVGLPLLIALLAALFMGLRGVRILQDGQAPYRGEKTLQLSRIRRGRIAALVGWAHVLAPLPMVAVAVWGAPHAQIWSSSFSAENFDYSECHNTQGSTETGGQTRDEA